MYDFIIEIPNISIGISSTPSLKHDIFRDIPIKEYLSLINAADWQNASLNSATLIHAIHNFSQNSDFAHWLVSFIDQLYSLALNSCKVNPVSQLTASGFRKFLE